MRAMGNCVSESEYKSFSDFASDLLGPSAGYFTGWTYWFCWVVTVWLMWWRLPLTRAVLVSRPFRLGRLAGGSILLLSLNPRHR